MKHKYGLKKKKKIFIKAPIKVYALLLPLKSLYLHYSGTFLSFMTLTCLTNSGPLFCRMSLHVALSDFSSLDSGLCFWQKYLEVTLSHMYTIRRHMLWICCTAKEVSFIYVVKMTSVNVSPQKINIFPL